MKRTFFIVATLIAAANIATAQNTSPNGRITIETTVEASRNVVEVCHNRRNVLTLTDVPLDGQLRFSRHVRDDYQMVAGKRLHCTNEANEYLAPLKRGGQLVMRLYNDGIAFRYERKEKDVPEAAFLIPEGTRRWMLQWTDSYEGFYPLSTTYRVEPVPSYSGISKSAEGYNNRWGFPALLEPVKGTFVLLTEANITKGQSASCLYNDGEQYRLSPTLTATTPWRLAIIGDLKDVVESTLVTDVSDPCRWDDTSWIKPGVVSWIYWAYNHGSNDYNIIKRYVDLAANLKLPYVLVDAEWDTMKDGHTIEEAVSYALSKGVRPLIWYNSSVGWVNGAPTPKYRLNTAEDREREFAWCEQIGVAGVKIDFFSGDDQRNMDFQIDLLESAARHHLLVNFHGATIPRGWQRTYPNLLSTEAVYGAEWYNNVATFTTRAAAHNATLPFTRNVIGPMDYTPCAFSDSQHPHITTHAHELALTVVFESALQHLADRPESLLAQPREVQQFLGELPTVWDDTRLLDGYPADYVAIARRRHNRWYIGVLNGTDQPRTIDLDLTTLQGANGQPAMLFADLPGDKGPWKISKAKRLKRLSQQLQPRGGLVVVIGK